jgi:hypothetical protein
MNGLYWLTPLLLSLVVALAVLSTVLVAVSIVTRRSVPAILDALLELLER